MRLNGLHFLQVERQHAIATDLQQFVVRNFQVNLANNRLRATDHFGYRCGDAAAGNKLFSIHNRPALNQAIGEETGDNLFGNLLVDIAIEQILDRGVNGFTLGKLPSGQVLDRLARSPTGIVSHAGAEADLDQHVETGGERPVDGILLNDRVAERAGGGTVELPGRQVGIDRIDINRPNLCQLYPQVLPDLAFDPFTAGIADTLLEADQNSVCHNQLQRQNTEFRRQ